MGVLWLPLPGCIHPFNAGTFNHPIPTCSAALAQVAPILSHSRLSFHDRQEGDDLKIYPFFMETLWESSEEEHCLSHPLALSVPIVSLPFQ